MRIQKPKKFVLIKVTICFTQQGYGTTEDSKDYNFKQSYDSNGNMVYYENFEGIWAVWEYNEKRQITRWYNYNGKWEIYEYDHRGNHIYFEDSEGCWVKKEYDKDNYEIYKETSSKGIIMDERN